MFSSTKKRLKRFGRHSKVHCARDSSPPAVDNRIEKNTLLEGVDHEILIHGPVTLRAGLKKKKHLAILYHSVLLISNSSYEKSLNINYRIPVNHLWIAECGRDTQRKGKPCLVERSFRLGWPLLNFVATFPSSAIKEKWYSLLERQINLAKEENYMHSILTEINIEAMNRSTSSIIVTVTNLDTVNDVINLSLPVLGLTGSEKDYQLLVSSANEEAPQPLIGHENIYTIQTTYLRAANPSPASENAVVLPSLHESTLEELCSHVCGYFILKPRCQATGQRKSGRRMTRLLRPNKSKKRGDLTKGDSSAAPLSVRFCPASLLVLSRKKKLTSPLSDLLYLIDKGSQAEGIFRKPGSIASYTALKQKISSGGTVDWSNESPLVAAAVLQDFLRSLPGTIFSAKLYDQWLDVFEEEDKNKVPAIQRLLAQLPKANFIILKCLFVSLNKIVQQSTFKIIATSDLSLCLAPRILPLWHSTSRSSEVADELRKKVSLTYFLIQNCPEIFKDATNSVLWKRSMIFYNNTGDNAVNCNNVSGDSDNIVDTKEVQSLDCQPMDVTLIKTSEELKGDSEATFDVGPPSLVSEFLLDNLVPLLVPTPVSSIDTDYTDHVEEDLRSITEELQTPLESYSGIETDEETQVGEVDKAPPDPHQERTQSQHSLRKWLNQWGFYGSRNSSLEEPTLPTPEPPQLFGSLIQDVCKNDNLPRPLLNFLSSIPGSLLTDRLYDSWLHVLDEGNKKTQIAAFQRLFTLLPTPNATILQSMFGSLFKIAMNSTSFNETTSDLSMHVALSLLWPRISDISERKTEWRRKVALVQFLIENYVRIFRSDIFTCVGEITIDPKSYPATADCHMKRTQTIHSIRKWLNQWGLCRNKDLQPKEPIPSSPRPVQLFESLIQDVCKDDKLPRSLLDMILLIEQKGPLTKDIFKKRGNEKSCRTLRYKLNYERQVNWESESAIDVATTLKGFLGSIPGSIFTDDLYNNWLCVLDKGNEETQIAAIQRLLGKLPKSNFKLLRSLFGVLEKIAKQSSLNNMTASKLSSCVAPSLFWLRGSTISARRKERRRKVAVVKFLIEHFFSIFGEDITSPVEENAINQDNYSETSFRTNA
nr:rho GTPase-activating protein 20 isoform X3 [Oryctolagus cuniculus]